MEAHLPNPLDSLTQDQSQDDTLSVAQIPRVYIYGDSNTPQGDNTIRPTAINAPLAQAVAPEQPSSLESGLAALRDYINGLPGTGNADSATGDRMVNRLLGTGGEQRYQTWPERMIRSGTTLPHDVMTGKEPMEVVDPDTGETTLSPQMIARTGDMAGLMGGSGLIERPGSSTLGSSEIRSGAKAVPEGTAPVFYSALEHAATNAAQDTMEPQQWLCSLKNQPGVKKEELDWSGLEGWLGDQKGKVKKDQVQDYLDAHKTDIKDVTKGNVPVTNDIHEETGRIMEDEYPELLEGTEEYDRTYDGISRDLMSDN